MRNEYKMARVKYMRGPRVPQERLDKIQELLNEGYTQKEIANIVGKSKGTIEYLIRQYGLHQMSRAERTKVKIPEKVTDLQEMLLQGKSQIECANALDISQGTVSTWIKKYSLTVVPHEYKRGVPSTETKQDIEIIKAMLKEKKNITEISNVVGVAWTTINAWIKKYDLDDSHIKRIGKTSK